MIFKEAKIMINNRVKKIPNKKITRAFEVKNGFVFLLENKNGLKTIDNPYLLVEKTSGKIKQYSPLNDSEEFKKASKINLLESVKS